MRAKVDVKVYVPKGKQEAKIREHIRQFIHHLKRTFQEEGYQAAYSEIHRHDGSEPGQHFRIDVETSPEEAN